MPIELRCTNSDCRTLLKAPDDSAGKAVKCPRCKTVVKVSEDAQPILDTLGGYELQRKLGEGGMGAVYEAVQVRLGRKVALKVLPRRFTDDEVFLERFHREARSAAALNHPNVIQVYDIDDDAGSHFFSMEYVDGESLQERLDREGRIPVEEALEITERVVDALSYAHGHSIIHRDIKPDNIMLGSDGRVKLADLGLAKKVDDEDSNITQTGASMGTPYYMSP
ncbi:MAG: protein kinase, partial [Planctomycetota bacterium]|nr:protein kinase [Planctomycetota bacterium]